MIKEGKPDKISKDFSLLPEEKQDHILGVLQTLAFANDITNKQIKTTPFASEQNTGSI